MQDDSKEVFSPIYIYKGSYKSCKFI